MHGKLALVLAVLLALLAAGCRSEPSIDGKTLAEWVDLLRHQDLSTQEQAQDALARAGADALPQLKRALRLTDPTLRRNAIRVFARLGPAAKDAVPALLARLAREKVGLLRTEILVALAAIDPAAPRVQEEFRKRLRDLDPDARAAAQAGLDRLDPTKAKPAPVAPKGPEIEEGLVLREASRLALEPRRPGVLFGLLAEVARGDRRAAVIWPAFREGEPLGGDLIALVFERGGATGWTFVEEVGPLARDGAQRLATALGGADGQRVLRPCGVKREELGGHLGTWGQAYAEKLAAGDPRAALEAWEKLTQAFAFPWLAYGDGLPALLAQGAFAQPWKIDPAGGDTPVVELTLAGAPQQKKAMLRACGEGLVVAELRPVVP